MSSLHPYLDELNVIPQEYVHLNLSGNGFYAVSTIKEIPIPLNEAEVSFNGIGST
jgi:hypothetical protein